jgi:pyruvate formate-lyase activating enzyme-like uncharacterized protein
MRDGGKGDRQRPIKNKEQFDKNWDNIFKKEKEVDDIEEYQKQAQELWFKGGSCTGGSPE